MKLEVEIPIQATKAEIWDVITDIDNAPDRISGIEKVEVHHNPGPALVGLKWTETRTLFGKTATETMWVTEAEKNKFYKTRAESHGAIYTSIMRIEEKNGQTYLGMAFSSQAQSFGVKFMATVLAPLFKGATKKALMKDLEDIKKHLEEQ